MMLAMIVVHCDKVTEEKDASQIKLTDHHCVNDLSRSGLSIICFYNRLTISFNLCAFLIAKP